MNAEDGWRTIVFRVRFYYRDICEWSAELSRAGVWKPVNALLMAAEEHGVHFTSRISYNERRREVFDMSYLTTFTGRHFDPTMPEAALIDPRDIAHALSLLCRGNGHVKYFWSVAQHCLACAAEAEARGLGGRVALACLLHDAGEAYLNDVIRPVKALLPSVETIEMKLLEAIWEKFLSPPPTEAEREAVFEIDDDMLAYDFHVLMAEDLSDRWKKLRRKDFHRAAPPAEIEKEYLECLKRLRHEC